MAAGPGGEGAGQACAVPGLPWLWSVGFCSVDDSVDAQLLRCISMAYPWVEWGVLCRPDKEGTPRYPTPGCIERLAEAKADRQSGGASMRLAAHLCGRRVNEVLEGDAAFVRSLASRGFGRVQVNATRINGVDTSRLAESAPALRAAFAAVPEVEWILQMNEETEPLFGQLLRDPASLPGNVSVLFDASCGTGKCADELAAPPASVEYGYAGGMGPKNIADILGKIAAVVRSDRQIWVDMESSLRSTMSDGTDIFDINKCFACITQCLALGARHAGADGSIAARTRAAEAPPWKRARTSN